MKETIVPFSSGTEAADWYSENCERCTKAFFPKEDGNWPSDSTMKKYCSTGKECKLKYYLDLGFITGEIPADIAVQIGYKNETMPDSCMMYSDNEDDRYQPPKQPRKPKPTGPNQMVMPFIIQEIGQPVKQLQLA
jgi:hypothetical protein